MSTDNDLPSNFFRLLAINSGRPSGAFTSFSRTLPMNPFLTGTSSPFGRGGMGVTRVRGVPGDVGGRARGAELIECAPRRWEGREVDGVEEGVRVFVKVIVTENGSPAK
jgi:hypothetical protein